MNYLVTGGAGFIGSAIVKKLVEMGESVRVVDNLSTGKLSNLGALIDKIDFIEGDLGSSETAKAAVYGMDYVLHQAALPSVGVSIENPAACNESIVTATVNVLKAAVDAKTVKRVVQASSAAVYGDCGVLPINEDTAQNPLSPYAAAKAALELYGKAFHNAYGLEIISLRYFNVYGENQDPFSDYSGVISRFANLMANGKPPVIYGDGEASRDFVYVGDVARANILACKCAYGKGAQAINIGSGKAVTINGLAQTLNSVLGTELNPVYESTRAGDIIHSLACIDKAKTILGYGEIVSFSEGIKIIAKRKA